MISMGIVEDDYRRLFVYSVQVYGVVGFFLGQFEIMFDRELLYDDDRGLGEGVQDNRFIQNDFVIQLEYKEDILINIDVFN